MSICRWVVGALPWLWRSCLLDRDGNGAERVQRSSEAALAVYSTNTPDTSVDAAPPALAKPSAPVSCCVRVARRGLKPVLRDPLQRLARVTAVASSAAVAVSHLLNAELPQTMTRPCDSGLRRLRRRERPLWRRRRVVSAHGSAPVRPRTPNLRSCRSVPGS